MKPLYILLFSLVLSASLYGQGLAYEQFIDVDYSQNITDLRVQDSATYVGATISSITNFSTSGSLLKYDYNGNLEFDINLNTIIYGETDKVNLLITKGNDIVSFSSCRMSCDVGGSFISVIKHTANGNLLWSTKVGGDSQLGVFDLGFGELFDSTIVFGGSGLYGSPKYIYKITNSGSLADSVAISFDYPKFFTSIDSSHFVAVTNNYIYKYDTALILLDSVILTSPPLDILHFGTDSLVVATSSELQIFTNNLTAQTPIALSNVAWRNRLKDNGNGTVSSLCMYNQDLAVLTLDNNFIPVDTVVYADPAINVYGKNDYSSYSLSSGANINLGQGYYYTGISVLNYRNALNIDRQDIDVKLSNLNVLSTSTIANSMNNYVFSVNAELEVMLTNLSADTLQDIKLNCYRGDGICNSSVFQKWYDSLALVPGDSVVLQLGWVGSGNRIIYIDSIQETICVYATSPNYKYDTTFVNSKTCATYLAGFVDIEEQSISNVSLFPNPTSETTTLVFEQYFSGDITISDIQGKIIARFSFQGMNKKIDLRKYESGVYMIQLQEDNGHRDVLRLVKR